MDNKTDEKFAKYLLKEGLWSNDLKKPTQIILEIAYITIFFLEVLLFSKDA